MTNVGKLSSGIIQDGIPKRIKKIAVSKTNKKGGLNEVFAY